MSRFALARNPSQIFNAPAASVQGLLILRATSGSIDALRRYAESSTDAGT